MKLPGLVYLAALFILCSCSTSINTQITKTYPPLDISQKVAVYDLPDPEPPGAEILGTIRIGDAGFTTNCGWETVIAQAQYEARKAGGNAIKITEHKTPDIMSSCHRITAVVLRVNPDDKPIAETPRYDSLRSATETPVQIQTNLQPMIKTKFPHFRIAIDGGYCYRTARIADNVSTTLSDYMKKLKNGWTVGGDAGYYFSESFGIGVKGNYSHFSNSMQNVVVYTETDTLTGNMADNIGLTYIAPELMMRFYNKKKTNAFIMNIGIGYLGYVNNATLIYDFKITGGTVGLSYDLGYDIMLTKGLALGIQGSFLLGTLSSVMVDDGTTKQTMDLGQDNKESLARINLTIGLRFIK